MSRDFALLLIEQRGDPRPGLLVGLLASSYVLIARAIAVPSAPNRTVWVSAAAMVLVASSNALAYLSASPTEPAAFGIMDLTAWAVAAVAMAGIGSRVIFGLRTEVTEARRLGQYTLEEKIGEGGMGAVYLARHALLRRPTAVKLLLPEKAGEENLQRFEREVQLTAQLSHPSIVAIFDYGRTPQGVFYYAMEYLDGPNLGQLVKREGPQPPGRVIHILRQVSEALAEAHHAGLIHRDIKPPNIILCRRGGLPDVAKVVDFGLVKQVFGLEPEAPTALAVTAANVIVGTPLYLSPETIGGDGHVDGRSDLYALGAVGYFLLTGEPVFRAKTVVEMAAHHLHTVPLPPSSRVDLPIPPDLEHVVLRCLAKAPDDRYASAQGLHDALADCALKTPWSREDALARWRH